MTHSAIPDVAPAPRAGTDPDDTRPPVSQIPPDGLLVVPNRYGTHAEVLHGRDAPAGPGDRPPRARLVLAGESLYGIPFRSWQSHAGETVDLLELQARAQEARENALRPFHTTVELVGEHWREEGPVRPVPLPASDFGFSTGRSAVACSREELLRQCLDAPETPAVWTPESGGLVRPEEVAFLVDALRRRKVESAVTQTSAAGWLLAALSAAALLAGAGPRSGWMVLCALAAAWLAVSVYQGGEAERNAGAGFASAREHDRHALWLRGRPAILTWVLVAMLVAVMVAQIYAPGSGLERAGLIKPLVREGEFWRLLTGALMHGSFLHLGLNVLAIWSLAPLVEAHGGRPVLPILFVASALVGSATSVWLIPDTPSVGASGGILGIVGYLFLLGYRRRHSLPQGFVGRMGIAILATGIFGIVGYALVDNAMHLGGLLTGMAVALVLPPEEREATPRTRRTVATLGDLALATLVIGAAGAIAMLTIG